MKTILIAGCLTGAVLSLGGCMAILPDFSRDLPGISLKPGASDPYLQNLSRRAQRHQDKQAMLELGMRYEEGRGVPVNWKLAERFYTVASISTGGSYWTSGPFATSAPRFIPGVKSKGLPEAKARLKALRAKRKALGR